MKYDVKCLLLKTSKNIQLVIKWEFWECAIGQI